MSFAVAIWASLGFGLAAITAGLRDRHRTSSLNVAMHELRRPLQTLALEPPPSATAAAGAITSLELAVAALDDLDDLINRRDGRASPGSAAVDIHDLVTAAAIRWRPRAARSGRPIRVRWATGRERLRLDPLRASQALDNLVANALEHGHGPVVIAAERHAGRLEISVRDGGTRALTRLRDRSDPRHGHGLAVTRELASRYGGELRIRRRSDLTTAALSFPLAGLRAPVEGTASRPRSRQ